MYSVFDQFILVVLDPVNGLVLRHCLGCQESLLVKQHVKDRTLP